MTIAFKKAIKYAAKGRAALIGPAGSGKSYSALQLARTLAGPGGKIAAIDTEHGSLSKYADLVEFDVIELDSCSPQNFLAALKAAEDAGYAAFIADSLSHFWMGKDGALEFVDMAKKRSSSRDDMAGWKEFRPHERQMIDAMIASPMHIICTMRTKTAYEEQVNERTGKKQRIKIGLAPVQREGLEYEFDLVGLMDEDNTFIVDKSRCPELTGKALTKPGEKEFATFRDWLSGAARSETPAPAPASAVPVASPSLPPAPRNPSPSFKVEGDTLRWLVKDVLEKKTPKGVEYRSVIFEGQPLPGKGFGACWDTKLFAALSFAVGEICTFRFEANDKFLNLRELLSIGDTPYKDGRPVAENLDAEPVEDAAAKLDRSLFITDSDLPDAFFDGEKGKELFAQ